MTSKSKSKAGGGGRVDDLWTKIETESSLDNIDQDSVETTLLVVGDSGCGKTTLINSFLKATSSKQPKPTFALDYSFARKKNASTGSGSSNSKSIAHIWELGGDIQEPALLEIPINVRNLRNLSILICCDLSKPHNALQSVRQWVKLVRDVISRRLSEYSSSSSEPFEMDETRAAQYLNHPDENIVSLSKIPMYLVANKYDIFKDIGSSERRATVQILRFLCHYYGVYFLTTSAMDASLRESFKSFMNSVCFRGPLRQAQDSHFDRPLHISPGKDSFENILLGSKSGEGGPESTPVKGSSQSKVFPSLSCASPHLSSPLFLVSLGCHGKRPVYLPHGQRTHSGVLESLGRAPAAYSRERTRRRDSHQEVVRGG
jgi:GTPase SAR1 family protein